MLIYTNIAFFTFKTMLKGRNRIDVIYFLSWGVQYTFSEIQCNQKYFSESYICSQHLEDKTWARFVLKGYVLYVYAICDLLNLCSQSEQLLNCIRKSCIKKKKIFLNSDSKPEELSFYQQLLTTVKFQAGSELYLPI